MVNLVYERNPLEIYRKSFAAIKREVALDYFPKEFHSLIIRLIHTCGMVDIANSFSYSPGSVDAGKYALMSGATIFTDVEMVKAGIIRRNLPADNQIVCTLNDERTSDLAAKIGNTRSAAAVDLWDRRLAGSVVAIGNAPTALFHLLERIITGESQKPALIIGFPVGFVGAIESKQILANYNHGCEFITLSGRLGGSAMASAAVNALVSALNINMKKNQYTSYVK